MAGAKRFGVDAEPARGLRPETVDHDVGARENRVEDRGRIRRSQIQRDAALVPVENLEVRAGPAADRRQRARRIAPARILNLDDVGPEVGEKQRRVRAGEQARQVDDANAGERL